MDYKSSSYFDIIKYGLTVDNLTIAGRMFHAIIGAGVLVVFIIYSVKKYLDLFYLKRRIKE
jgi:hypothetical protein